MKITTTTTYDVKYKVEYYEDDHGGMTHESFGNSVSSIEEALEIWNIANISQSSYDWIITCEVEKVIK